MKQINNWWFPDRDFAKGRIPKMGFQLDHLQEALQYITDWSVAIDGGANVGFWAQKMSEKFNMVHAFEIDPETFACLELNCPDVFAQNCGLSDEIDSKIVADGWNGRSLGMHLEARVATNNLHGRAKSYRRNDGVLIPTVTIDSLNLASLGFIKLDVEGHEAQVLEGGKETLSQYKPIVMIEYKPAQNLNKRYGESDPVQVLEELGATLIKKVGKNEIDWIFGWK